MSILFPFLLIGRSGSNLCSPGLNFMGREIFFIFFCLFIFCFSAVFVGVTLAVCRGTIGIVSRVVLRRRVSDVKSVLRLASEIENRARNSAKSYQASNNYYERPA